MYNDSEPITSPLICRLLPIVARSAAARDAGEVLEGFGSWNPEILARYGANRLRVVRQVRYSLRNENCIDLVLFLNGKGETT
jgi:hypothetical protein